MLIYKPYELSREIKSLADLLASAAKREGISSALIMVNDGNLSFIDLQAEDETHFLKWINSTCYELDEVE